MSAPVTAEELAAIARLDREATPGPWRTVDRWDGSEVRSDPGTRAIVAVDLCAEDASFIAHARTAAPRLAHDLAAERDTSARLADKVLDLGRELEALRAAVQEHEADTRGPGMLSRAWNQADLDLWAAAKT